MALVIEIAVLGAFSFRTVFVTLGISLITAGILYRLACTKLESLARFEKSSREVRLHLMVTGALCIVSVLGTEGFLTR